MYILRKGHLHCAARCSAHPARNNEEALKKDKKRHFQGCGREKQGALGRMGEQGGDDAEQAAMRFGCVSSWRCRPCSEHPSFVNRLGPGSLQKGKWGCMKSEPWIETSLQTISQGLFIAFLLGL